MWFAVILLMLEILADHVVLCHSILLIITDNPDGTNLLLFYDAFQLSNATMSRDYLLLFLCFSSTFRPPLLSV